MQLSNSYNPSIPVSIEDNNDSFLMWNNINSYKILKTGIQVTNPPNNWSEIEWCLEGTVGATTIRKCVSELQNWNWVYGTDNLTYAYLYGENKVSTPIGNITIGVNYSLTDTSDMIKIEIGAYNGLTQDIINMNFSYEHHNITISNNWENDFVGGYLNNNWTEVRLNRTLDNIIENITNNTFWIFDKYDTGYIKFNWSSNNAFVYLKSNSEINTPVRLIVPAGNLSIGQIKRTTFFWIDPINSVTLDDPTTNIAIYSSRWFWMNCTAAKSGAGDTPQYLYFEHNETNGDIIQRKIPVNTTSSTLNTSSTNPISSFSYATMYSINVSTPNANGYQVRCLANNTAGTTVTSVVRKITVLQTNVTFNMSSLNLGSTGQSSAPLMKSALVFSNGTNNDVNISCLTGSCSTITTNFTAVNLLDNGTKTAFFNCSTGTAGFFSANFSVNSTEYQNSTLSNTKQMNVSCTIIETIPPDIKIVNPLNNSIIVNTTIHVNYTYGTDANAIWYEFDSNNTNITITTGTNITFNNLAYIIHNISLFANDSSNNINSSFINFSITFNQTHCGGSYNETDMTDWNITTDVKCVNEYIQVDGNITVSPNGNLTLINSTINFTAPINNNSYILSVYPLSNGLWVYDSDNDKSTTNDMSVITSSNNNFINVTIKDDVDIVNSRLNRLGRTATNSLEITGTNVTRANITGNLIENSIIEIITVAGFVYVGGANISFNNFTSGIISQMRYSTIQNNNIKCLDATTNGCVRIRDLEQIIRNNTIECSNLSNAIYIRSDGNSFSNNRISNCQDSYFSSIGDNSVFINDSITGITGLYITLENISGFYSSNNTFINVSGITENLTSISDASTNENSFFIKYFLEVQAIDNTTGIAINNTNVTVYDRYNNLVKTTQTNSNGLTTLFVVTDYKKNNTATVQNFTTSFNVHNITASASGYNFNSTTSNVTSSRRAVISIFTPPDTTPPDILIRNPSNNSVIANTTVQANYTYSTDVNRIWYELDSNNTNITITNGANITFDNLAKIVHNISLYANDSSNNINSSFINFSIKSSNPNLVIFNPINNSVYVSGTTKLTLNFSATDTSLHKIWFEYDSNNTNITITGNLTFDTSAGLHNITLWVNDTANNFNMSYVNFSVSQVTYCSGNFNSSNNNFDISTNVLCQNEAMDINGNITILSGGNLTFKNITIIFQTTADGSHYINKTKDGGLWILDNDNNQSTSNDASNITAKNTNFEYDFWVFGNGLRDNFTMQNSIIREAGYLSGSLGFQLYNVSNAVISGNNITGGNNYGLYLQYSSNNNITGNAVNSTSSPGAGGGYGIYLVSSSSSNNIQNNTITTNAGAGGIAQDSNYGIYLTTGSGSSIIQGNTVTTKATGANNIGIYINTVSNSNISDNTIATSGGSGNPGPVGIYLVSNSSTIIKNNIIDTASPGIYTDSSSNLTIQNNTITSTLTAIYLLTSSNSIIQNNSINTSGSGYGIYLLTSSNNNTIKGNSINTSGGSGIYLSSSSSSTLSGNTITTNDTLSYGLYLDQSDFNNFSLNTINSSSSDSIFLDRNSDNNTISFNTIKFSKNSAIRIQNSSSGIMPQNNTIINNNITNATNGISIFMNSTRPFAVNHTIENNNITFTTNALYISNSSNINISLGLIRNSTNGITLFYSKQINVTNTTFISNTYDFNITNSSSLTSINNTFNKTVKVMDESNFTIMWFAEVYITDNQSNTNVSVWNTTGARHYNTTTNSNGLTNLFLLTEYIRNNTANLTSNNPFNFTASNTTFFNSTSVNIDKSMRVKIGFTAGAVPVAISREEGWYSQTWIGTEKQLNKKEGIFIRFLNRLRRFFTWIF